MSVKSGPNWGNSSQWKSLELDFKTARKILSQSDSVKHVETILGICYGKSRTVLKRGIILQVTGQNFWHMLSGDEKFYIEIVEPLGHRAKQLNEEFNSKKAQIINKFTKEFTSHYCDRDGKILWSRIVAFNSGNFNGSKPESA